MDAGTVARARCADDPEALDLLDAKKVETTFFASDAAAKTGVVIKRNP